MKASLVRCTFSLQNISIGLRAHIQHQPVHRQHTQRVACEVFEGCGRKPSGLVAHHDSAHLRSEVQEYQLTLDMINFLFYAVGVLLLQLSHWCTNTHVSVQTVQPAACILKTAMLAQRHPRYQPLLNNIVMRSNEVT
jgi:hypothetical protein